MSLPNNSEQVTPRLPHLLPKDLPGALRRLTDDELEKLFSASSAEMRHRKLMSKPINEPSVLSASPKPQQEHRTPAVVKVSKAADPLPITQGKLNAIQAALKAGVKPNTIARQFGVTPAMIKKAMEDP